MKNILAILVSIHSLASCSQSKIEIPENYKQTELSKENSEGHHKLNYSKDIAIKLTARKIETFPVPKKTNTELPFEDGLLVGSNHGEWGGKLIYKVGEKENEIKEANIISIFELDGKIFFLEGLAHGSTNYGEIYSLDYSAGNFTYKKILQLPGEPEVFQIFNKKLFIATFDSFVIIDNWKIENEIKGFWASLYPNSLIIENENHIFMGIRGGIVEITPKQKVIKLYTKTD